MKLDGGMERAGWKPSDLHKHHREQLINSHVNASFLPRCQQIDPAINTCTTTCSNLTPAVASSQYEESSRHPQFHSPESTTAAKSIHPSRVSSFSSKISNVWKTRVILKYSSHIKVIIIIKKPPRCALMLLFEISRILI